MLLSYVQIVVLFCGDADLSRSQREAPDSRLAEQILKDTAAGAPHLHSTTENTFNTFIQTRHIKSSLQS